MTDFTPDFSDTDNDGANDDDLSIDFSGVEARSGFKAVPAAWYLCKIDGFKRVEVGPDASKLPEGTPGTNWEFIIQEDKFGGKHEGQHLWTSHYHHHTTLPYMKGMLVMTGEFTEEELNSQFNLGQRERAVDSVLCVKVTVRKWGGEDRNNISGFELASEWPRLKEGSASSTDGATSAALLPD
jgi:hypothetical protein